MGAKRENGTALLKHMHGLYSAAEAHPLVNLGDSIAYYNLVSNKFIVHFLVFDQSV